MLSSIFPLSDSFFSFSDLFIPSSASTISSSEISLFGSKVPVDKESFSISILLLIFVFIFIFSLFSEDTFSIIETYFTVLPLNISWPLSVILFTVTLISPDFKVEDNSSDSVVTSLYLVVHLFVITFPSVISLFTLTSYSFVIVFPTSIVSIVPSYAFLSVTSL